MKLFIKLLYISFLLQQTFTAALASNKACRSAAQPDSKIEQWITIFVHGSIGLEKHLCYETCCKLFKDDLLYSRYHIDTELKRLDANLYKNQPIQEKGLQKVTGERKYSGAKIFTQLFKQIDALAQPKNNHTYYTFGWTGMVSVAMRYRESYVFYNELKAELEKIKKKSGNIPKIRIIGYSHGGNIAINLSQIQRENFPNDTWQVDELILLGAPLQKINAYEVYQNFFQKIYNIYSRADYVQFLDVFSPYNFFSHRTFSQLHNVDQYPHIYDIEIRIQQLRNNLLLEGPYAEKIALHNLRKRAPGHAELWFFSWNTNHYRSDFCLNPLPLSLFIPSIIENIKTFAHQNNQITLLLAPEFGKAFISNGYKKMTEIPYLEPGFLQICKQQAYDLQASL